MDQSEPVNIPSDTGSLPPVWWNPPYQIIPQPVEIEPTRDEDLLSLWATADELASNNDDDVLSLLPPAGEGALDSDAAPTSSRSHIVSSQESEDSREFVDQASTLGTASDGTTGGYLASGQSDNEPLSSRYCDTPSTPPLGKRRPTKYTASKRNEKLLQAAIKASLKQVPTARVTRPPRLPLTQLPIATQSPVKGKEPTIEAHGRYYTLVEYSRKYCRLHPDPSGKTCKYIGKLAYLTQPINSD